MNTSVMATIHTREDNHIEFHEVESFRFHKDKYMANTELSIVLQDKTGAIPPSCTINRIELAVDGNNLHQGLIDNAEIRMESGVTELHIRSRGFTSLLMANEMEPGLHYNISLNGLMNSYYSFPSFIKWKIDHNAVNYIYVKPHRSMWDGVINIAYKLYGQYPYIRYANEINLQAHSDVEAVILKKSDYIASGWVTNTKGMLSHLHMQDIEGNYGVYEHTWSEADDMYIVRHKQIGFDRQYLDEPERSMELLFSTAAQKWRQRYIVIPGYRKIDINDFIAADGIISGAKVGGITVTGDRRGVTSRIEVYSDRTLSNN